MHATAIAEDVMEQFEAHTLEEMADTYETVTPTDFTNNVQRCLSGCGRRRRSRRWYLAIYLPG